jgi:hypothetical protein
MPHESARRTKSPIGPRIRLESSSEARWRWGGARETPPPLDGSLDTPLTGKCTVLRPCRRASNQLGQRLSPRSRGASGVLAPSSWLPPARFVGFPGLLTAKSSGGADCPGAC